MKTKVTVIEIAPNHQVLFCYDNNKIKVIEQNKDVQTLACYGTVFDPEQEKETLDYYLALYYDLCERLSKEIHGEIRCLNVVSFFQFSDEGRTTN